MDKKKPKILDLREMLNKQEDKSTIIPRTVSTEAVKQAKKMSKPDVIRTAAPALQTEVDIAEAKGELSAQDAQESRQLINNPDMKVKKNSVASKFTSALSAFAPDLIGLAVGGLLGGEEGAVEGFKFGKEAGDRARDISQQQFDNSQKSIQSQLQQQQANISAQNAQTSAGTLALNEQKFVDSSAEAKSQLDLIDTRTGGILATTDEGKVVDQQGNEVPVEFQKNLRIERESRQNRQGDQRINIAFANSDRGERKFINKKEEQVESDNLKLVDSFEKDPAVKGIRDAQAMITPAKAALASGSPMAPGIAANALARLNGEKGPLTESDLSRFGGRQDIASKMKRLTAKQTTGTPMTAQDNKDFLFLLNVMEDINTKRLESIKGRKIKSFSRASGDITEASGRNILDAKETPRQRLERLRKLKAGK